jgi:hypothetical protein
LFIEPPVASQTRLVRHNRSADVGLNLIGSANCVADANFIQGSIKVISARNSLTTNKQRRPALVNVARRRDRTIEQTIEIETGGGAVVSHRDVGPRFQGDCGRRRHQIVSDHQGKFHKVKERRPAAAVALFMCGCYFSHILTFLLAGGGLERTTLLSYLWQKQKSS